MIYEKLTDVCDFQGGSQPPKEEWSFEKKDGYIRMLQIRDFTQSERVTPEYIKISGTTKTCEEDDILIARYGASLGKILTGLAGAYNVAIMKTIPNESVLSKKYLYYYLKSPYFQTSILNVGSRAAQSGFNKEDLSRLDINCPPFEEQDNMVRILQVVENAIKYRETELEKLDKLIKARFVELFGDPSSNPKGWNIVELGNLTGIGSSKRIFEKEYVSDGIPFYRTKEIVELSKGNSISTELFISEERFAEIKEQYGVPKAGDLLISAVGTIGVIWIVDGKNDFYFKDGNLIRVDGSGAFDSVYMKTLLESLISEYKKQMSSGTAYAALTISGLTKMKVYDAPMDLQKQFAGFVNQVDKSKVVVQQALNEAKILLDCLMHKYFK